MIKIKENERLHSKGRGRKYRTKEEKDILHKFNYSYNQELENDEKDEKENFSMNNEENLNHRNKLNYSGMKYSTEKSNQHSINQNSKIKKEENGNEQINSFFI